MSATEGRGQQLEKFPLYQKGKDNKEKNKQIQLKYQP